MYLDLKNTKELLSVTLMVLFSQIAELLDGAKVVVTCSQPGFDRVDQRPCLKLKYLKQQTHWLREKVWLLFLSVLIPGKNQHSSPLCIVTARTLSWVWCEHNRPNQISTSIIRTMTNLQNLDISMQFPPPTMHTCVVTVA